MIYTYLVRACQQLDDDPCTDQAQSGGQQTVADAARQGWGSVPYLTQETLFHAVTGNQEAALATQDRAVLAADLPPAALLVQPTCRAAHWQPDSGRAGQPVGTARQRSGRPHGHYKCAQTRCVTVLPSPPSGVVRAALPAVVGRSKNQFVERLYDAQAGALLKYLTARFHNHDEAVEVAQEAWLRIYRLEHPEELRNAKVFLFQTASNVAIDRLRRNQLENRYHDREASQPPEPVRRWNARCPPRKHSASSRPRSTICRTSAGRRSCCIAPATCLTRRLPNSSAYPPAWWRNTSSRRCGTSGRSCPYDRPNSANASPTGASRSPDVIEGSGGWLVY